MQTDPSLPTRLDVQNGDGSETFIAVERPNVEPEPPVEPGKLLRAAAKRRAQLSELLSCGADSLADPDHVHDVRVAARRLGEVARLVAPYMDKPTARAVDASLKSLRRSMGELRDADVTREHLLKWRMPGPVKKVAREVAAALEEKRPALQAAAAGQLTSASVSGTMVILARILEDRAKPQAIEETERRLRTLVQSHLKKREKQMRRSFGRAARKQTAASLHEARITVKKLRYVMELAQDSSQKGAKAKVRFLKQLQELFGDHHDTHVILEQVHRHLQDPREKPLKNLASTYRQWLRQTNQIQAQRAGAFFTKSYTWING